MRTRFWGEQGRSLDWIRPYTKIRGGDFSGAVKITWFEDGTLNAAANCIDRHLPQRAGQTAIIWEPDDPAEAARHITYAELHDKICAFANVLKRHGVVKGDRVIIYLPMIPEAAFAPSGLRAYRGRAFGGVCGIFAAEPARPHQ